MTPWPYCVHGKDATLCDECWADWAGLKRRLRWRRWCPWIVAREAYWTMRAKRDDRSPF